MDNPESKTIDDFLREIGVGRRALNDKFFDESHETCKVFQRTGITVEDDEELCHEVMREFPCNVFGCKARFRNLIDFEIHYNGTHRYVCQECKKMRPNARLLEIHIQETHDSFFLVLAEKQPMYQCYVSECDAKFLNSSERRNHCITAHKFPKNFRYDGDGRKSNKTESKDAMDVEEVTGAKTEMRKHKTSLNKNQRTKTFLSYPSHRAQSSQISVTAPSGQTQNVALVGDASSSCEKNEATPRRMTPITSALAFVPRQVAQKSYSGALTKGKNMQRNVMETETMMELAESLPK